MAFRTMLFFKLSVFIFVFVCVQRLGLATKEPSYKSVEVSDDAVSVIALEHGGRYRRQATDATPTATTPSTTESTTPLDLGALNILHDDQLYYKSTTIVKSSVAEYWVELKNVTGHKTLSDSHRTAVTATLPFEFRFYGHIIDKVTIATGGFLYMSPFLHQWLTATQYIAPLMANFDTQIGDNSEILYQVSDTKFVVEWRDVHLQDQNESDPFNFQAILHNNGTIVFVYKQLPLPIANISSTAHPVKIGLSDAFYYDTNQFGQRRRTIYEYHRVTVNMSQIQEGTVIILNPLPTCNLFNTCEACVGSGLSFPCRWCGITKKCSDTLDWFRQEWMDNGCMQYSGSANCSSIPTSRPQDGGKGISTQSTTLTDYTTGKQIHSRPSDQFATIPSDQGLFFSDKGSTVAIIVIVVVVVLVVVGLVGGWFYYAYTHPTSASGIWLMENRPSQLKAKMNNMKFWKKNSSAGDKYAVESTA